MKKPTLKWKVKLFQKIEMYTHLSKTSHTDEVRKKNYSKSKPKNKKTKKKITDIKKTAVKLLLLRIS